MTDASRLTAQLGSWRERPGPLFARLADALGAVIERGALDGTRLPAERRLAVELGVSRSLVVRAYELLRERQLVSSRERSGTVVRSLGTRRAAPGAQLPQLPQLLASDGRGLDLAVGSPPLDELVAGVGVALGDAAGLVPPHGYAPFGMGALREALAARMTARGVPTTVEEVLVTSGAHEALALIAALLVGRGQPVAVEQPTYPGALEIFERAGGRPVGVAGDAAGMRADALDALLGRAVAALVYLMPGCHSPTGASIASGRRPSLLALAERHDALVVEDATLDELRFAGPLPSLRRLAPERVLHVGSLSKVAWAGLRVGWICGPRDVVGRLAALKGARDLGAGALEQLAALRLLADLERITTIRRGQARGRMRLLRDALAQRVPAWEIPEPAGGWTLWADLGGADGDAFVAAAARAGVHVAAGRPHYADGRPVSRVRISYASPDTVLLEGAERLAAAWATLRPLG